MRICIDGKKITKIDANDVICFFFWLCYYVPPCLQRIMPLVGTLARLLSYLLFIIFMAVNIKKGISLSRFHAILLALLVWCGICVWISSPASTGSFLLRTCFTTVELLFFLHISIKEKGINGIMPLYYVCCIYIFINFVSLIAFPAGMFTSAIGSSVARAQWVFGSKNNMPIYIVTFITVIATVNYVKNGKKSLWVYLFMAMFSVMFSGGMGIGFLEGSSTGIIALLICSVAIICLVKFRGLPHVITPINTIIGAAVLNVILLGGHTIGFVNRLLTDLFGKSTSFSGRTNIWLVNINKIASSPIIGYGTNTFKAPVYTEGILTTTTYTYNMLLKYIISYGIVSIILLALLLIAIKGINKTHVQLLNVGLIGIIVIGTMNEVALYDLLLFPIMMAAFADTKNSTTQVAV